MLQWPMGHGASTDTRPTAGPATVRGIFLLPQKKERAVVAGGLFGGASNSKA